MKFLEQLENNSLIICNNSLKENILLEINNMNKLINFKLMTINEFFDSFFFSYDEKTVYYIKNKYNVTKEIALIYLDNLKYVFNINISNSKINKLKDIYIDLLNNNLLKFDLLFKNYLKDKKLYLVDLTLDNFTKNIFKDYNYIIINPNINKRLINDVYHFKNIEEEVSFVFNKISCLIKNNIDINNIKLILLGNEYNNIVKRFSKLYNININNIDNNSLYGLVVTNNLLDLIYNNYSKEEILDYLKKIDSNIANSLLNIINKYYFVDNLLNVIDFIIDDLKNTKLNNNILLNAIDIVDINTYIDDKSYVFMLGFNNENIPRTYKDIDFFNDELKNKLNLFTSIEKNIIEKNKIIEKINNIKNIYITYKDIDSYNSYYPSNLINELKLIEKEEYLENNTSNLYNKILLTDKLDLLLKYNIKDNMIDKLYNSYPNINYLTYNNKFTKIDNFKLDNINLSYTSIDNYYHCAFRYYIDNILHLNIYEESFKQFIGTMFHYILKNMYNKDFDFEKIWNNYLKNKEFSKKELFYLKDLKEELLNVIKILNYQYNLTGLTNLKLEEKIDINLNNNYKFTGIIDKIMYKEKDDKTYISIIDYKTGNPNINLDNIKYGIDMQLPIYVYLVLNSNLFVNPQIIGFYLQKIIHEKSSYSDKDLESINIDKLKLQGYSINDTYLISMFDPTYENSNMIKSMKITSKGFSHYTKVLSDIEIINILNIVENKIKEAFDKINNGEFTINPKVIKGENIGCSFCKYQDLCFKTGKDLVYLKEEN